MSRKLRHYDAVVIGAGLSGLLAASALADRGARILVVAKGGGYLHFSSGCVDVLGATPDGGSVMSPIDALDGLTAHNRKHPFALTGAQALQQGVNHFLRVMEEQSYPFVGSLDRNVTLPTAIGSTRTSCMTPAGMVHGDLGQYVSTLIVGFVNFRDFYPPYCAGNLSRAMAFPVRGQYLDVDRFRSRRHLLSLDVARAFDEPAFRMEIAREVQAHLGDAKRVGFPAVLGLRNAPEAIRHLSDLIGVPVFEIPTLPPSVAGIRVDHALRQRLIRAGVRIEIGFWVKGTVTGEQATDVRVQSAGKETQYGADTVILATGGTGGGGIRTEPDGRLLDTVFDLPVAGPHDRTQWFYPQFLGPESQPISAVGIETNDRLRPMNSAGSRVENLFVTASNLPGWDPTREKSGEGVALATGWKAAQGALAHLNRSRTAELLSPSATISPESLTL